MGPNVNSVPKGLDSSAKRMHSKRRNHNRNRAKILIADGEGVFRLGLKKLFSVEDDLRVVAQAENSHQLVAMAKSFRPDLALVQKEIALNGYGGLLAQIHRTSPNCKVLVTSSRLTDAERGRLLRDGASGMISRSTRPELFVQNVRRLIKGKPLCHPLTQDTEERYPENEALRPRPVETLTPKEKAIISCLTQGWRNRDIAQHLMITEQTVKNHLRSIFDKVGVSDRLELVLYAIHQRLELPPVNL